MAPDVRGETRAIENARGGIMKGVRSALIMFCLAVMFGCATKSPPSVDPLQEARQYYEQGKSLSREGRFEDALAAFKKAARVFPGYGNAYYNMGIIYHELGQDEKAIEAYTKAIEINPRDAAAHMNLGNVFMRQGRLSAAIVELETAVKIDPAYELAHGNLAYAYYVARMYHRAKDHLNELERLGFPVNADLKNAVNGALNLEKPDMTEEE